MKIRSLMIIFALLVSSAVSVSAQEINFGDQTSKFKKVFGYVNGLKLDSKFNLIVLYDTDAQDQLLGALKAFQDVGITPNPVHVENIEFEIKSASVVYLLPSVSGSKIRKLCDKHHVLSISADSKHVNNGDVSVGLLQDGAGKIDIVVNTKRTKKEGQNLSAQLLQISKIKS